MPSAPPPLPDFRLASIGEGWRLYKRRPLRISAAFLAYLIVVGLVATATAALEKSGVFGWPGTVFAKAVDFGVGCAAMAGLLRFMLACMKSHPEPSYDLLVPDAGLLGETAKGGAFQAVAVLAGAFALVLPGAFAGIGVLVARYSPAAGWLMSVAGTTAFVLVGAVICRLAWSWMLWQPLLVAGRKEFGRALSLSNAVAWTRPGSLLALFVRLLLLNLLGLISLGLGFLVTGPVSILAVFCACRSIIKMRKEQRMAPPRAAWRLGPAALSGFGLIGAAVGVLLAAEGEVLSTLFAEPSNRVKAELTREEFVEADRTIRLAPGFRYIPMEEVRKLSDGAFRSTGTGFFVTDEGDMLSNRHVVEKCRRVITRVGSHVVPVAVVDLDDKSDLALLKVSVKDNHFVPMPAEHEYRIGQQMMVFGWGHPSEEFDVQLSSAGQLQSGLVNATRGIDDDDQYFQISAPLNPGNSGGAIVDRFGLFAGVASQSLARIGSPGIGFGLKVRPVLDFLGSRGVQVTTYRPGQEASAEVVGELLSQASRKLYCLH